MTDHQTPQKDIQKVYVDDFNRIIKCVEARCLMTGDTASTGEIETQIALRSAIMKISSSRRELTSIRAVITWFLEEESWPTDVDDLDWLNQSDMEDVGQLHSGLLRTSREFSKIGQDISVEQVARVMEMNFPGSEEDAARALSGIEPTARRRKSRNKKSMDIITERDFMELELHFSDHPHQNALKTLSLNKTDNKALLRIFMRTIRLTGIRPVEIFKCRLFVGNVSHEYSTKDILNIHDAPSKAVMDGRLTAIDDIDSRPWGSMAAMVRDACFTTSVPPIFLIESAKTTNANPDLLRPFRAQILKDIEDDDLEILCLAAHIHYFKIDKKRRSNLITSMTRNLSIAADKVLPKRNDTMNLYSFRHDFATRARLSLQIWEVAALMGHTAKSSTYLYGKRNTRKKSGSGSNTGWMPTQDTEFSEAIREKWSITLDQIEDQVPNSEIIPDQENNLKPHQDPKPDAS